MLAFSLSLACSVSFYSHAPQYQPKTITENRFTFLSGTRICRNRFQSWYGEIRVSKHEKNRRKWPICVFVFSLSQLHPKSPYLCVCVGYEYRKKRIFEWLLSGVQNMQIIPINFSPYPSPMFLHWTYRLPLLADRTKYTKIVMAKPKSNRYECICCVSQYLYVNCSQRRLIRRKLRGRWQANCVDLFSRVYALTVQSPSTRMLMDLIKSVKDVFFSLLLPLEHPNQSSVLVSGQRRR